MFKEFYLREVKGGLKSPMVYIFLFIMTLMVTAAVVSDNVTIGGAIGNVKRNAPHIITTFTGILSIFGLLFATAFFNNAALRDFNYQFNEIIFTTPIKKSSYFLGRFLGALTLATIPMIGVFLGITIGTVLGPLAGWIDPERMGPVYWSAFLSNYLLFILPNMLLAGAIIFGLAARFRSTVVAFVGTLLIIIGYLVSGTFLSDLDSETLAALSDMFGIRAYGLDSKYFTPAEKNTLIPSVGSLLFFNRLIWGGVGILITMVSYYVFSFKEKQKRIRKQKDESEMQKADQVELPTVQINFTRPGKFAQFLSFFKMNFLSIVKSTVFRILVLFSFILLVSSLWGGFEYYGLQSYPLTYKVLGAVNGSVSLFLMIVMVFFSGELIWRDRDSKINEVVDATPHSALLSLLAKSFSLVSVGAILYLAEVVFGIGYQLIHGFTKVDLSVYLASFVFSILPTLITWGFILIFIQVLINHKYIGYFVAVLFMFVVDILLSVLDVESNMLSIASGPYLKFSDLSGFGPGLKGAIWFKSYWILFGFLVLLLAGLFWNRGVSNGLKHRFQLARTQIKGAYAMLSTICLVLWLLVAGNVYYNTQVLNTYKTSDQEEELRVQYEKQYRKYKDVPKPIITDAKYKIDIYPEQRDVYVTTDLTLKNKTGEAIDSLHYTLDRDWNQELIIPGAREVYYDAEVDYKIFALAQPIMPGESLQMTIKSKYVSKGFENSTPNTRIVANGTFLNNMEILPAFGYSESREISDKYTRKKHDLKPKERMPKLESPCGKNCHVNYLSDGNSDWVNVETVISTSGDQLAIAPGSLIKEWKENDRNYFHYKVDHPSQNFYSFMSARYEVARKKWNDIDIEVYYDRKHDYNIKMMQDAVERSLKYYTENFGPYYHKQVRIIEFPRYQNFAQAFPGTMPYSESFGFVVNLEDEEDNNVIDAVIAHEMAHQWWAHQEISASMQGATMITESFAEYSSLMVMKSVSDDVKMKDFLKYDMDRYLNGRSSEREKELPLYKVENQTYIHYGKGAVVMYALQDYIGEDKVNFALKSFLEEYRYQEPPYPTSKDFLRHLEPVVPDSLHYLIDDWFREITMYDHRLQAATYSPVDSGKYLVSLDVESWKIKADSIGNETKVAINDWVDVGFYADAEEKELIWQKRVKFDKPKMTLEFVLDQKPYKAAVDPRRLLIERVSKDNVKVVELREEQEVGVNLGAADGSDER